MQERFEKVQKECLAVLNDDQMLDWTNLCGKAFKFPNGNRSAVATGQTRNHRRVR